MWYMASIILGIGATVWLYFSNRGRNDNGNKHCNRSSAVLTAGLLVVGLFLTGCHTASEKTATNSSTSTVYNTLTGHFESKGLVFSIVEAKDASLTATNAEDNKTPLRVYIQRNKADGSLYSVQVETTIDKDAELQWVAQQVLPTWSQSSAWINQHAKAGAPSLTVFKYETADIHLLSGGNTADTKNLATLTIYPTGKKKTP